MSNRIPYFLFYSIGVVTGIATELIIDNKKNDKFKYPDNSFPSYLHEQYKECLKNNDKENADKYLQELNNYIGNSNDKKN